MSKSNGSKGLAILAYFTFVGLIIAFIMNLEKRNRYVFFHIRQMLGLILMLIVSNVIEAYVNSLFGSLLWVITFICWLHGLTSAIKGNSTEIPFLGQYFQSWFENIK